MATLLHLLLALALTFFLGYQARSLAIVLRSRGDRRGRPRTLAALAWSGIPVLVVVFLAARSWMAVLDVARPAIASGVTAAASSGAARPIPTTSAP